jgi:hypothetical protein
MPSRRREVRLEYALFEMCFLSVQSINRQKKNKYQNGISHSDSIILVTISTCNDRILL